MHRLGLYGIDAEVVRQVAAQSGIMIATGSPSASSKWGRHLFGPGTNIPEAAKTVMDLPRG